MTRKRPNSWRGIGADAGFRPPPLGVECYHGHVTKTTARDGQLIRCIQCQQHGEATWILVHRENAYS